MKKGEVTESHRDNSFGTSSVILGILSIAFTIVPIYGIIFSILGIVFANKQKKHYVNKWSKSGLKLSIVGLVLSVITWILSAKVVNDLILQNATP